MAELGSGCSCTNECYKFFFLSCFKLLLVNVNVYVKLFAGYSYVICNFKFWSDSEPSNEGRDNQFSQISKDWTTQKIVVLQDGVWYCRLKNMLFKQILPSTLMYLWIHNIPKNSSNFINYFLKVLKLLN